jgi:hypothetical protein
MNFNKLWDKLNRLSKGTLPPAPLKKRKPSSREDIKRMRKQSMSHARNRHKL